MWSRRIVVLGAPSSIGIRPYDDGRIRDLSLAPAALRGAGLVERLGATDSGDVVPPPYRDRVRPPGRARNEAEVAAYSRALAERVEDALADGSFVVVLGGDCSILLGALLGARAASGADVGVVYLDAHADFATPEESQTGSVASMDLALATGRGDSPLARLSSDGPLVRASDVALLGRRDYEESWYGHDALARQGVLDLTDRSIDELGVDAVVGAALERMSRPGLGGFWIHVDADVIDPVVMPAVDSPLPDGLELSELSRLLAPLVRDPRALGLQVTIYDPSLDPSAEGARRLVDLLVEVLGRDGPGPA